MAEDNVESKKKLLPEEKLVFDYLGEWYAADSGDQKKADEILGVVIMAFKRDNNWRPDVKFDASHIIEGSRYFFKSSGKPFDGDTISPALNALVVHMNPGELNKLAVREIIEEIQSTEFGK